MSNTIRKNETEVTNVTNASEVTEVAKVVKVTKATKKTNTAKTARIAKVVKTIQATVPVGTTALQTIDFVEEVSRKTSEFSQPYTNKEIKKYVESQRKAILKKETSVVFQGFTTRKDGSLVPMLVGMDENTALRMKEDGLKSSKGKTTVRFGNGATKVTNFSKDMIVFNFSTSTKMFNSMTEFSVVWNGAKTQFIYEDKENNMWIDMATKQEVSCPVGKRGYRKFEMCGGSPAQVRGTQIVAFDVTEGIEKVENMFDILTCGGYTIQSKLKGKKVSDLPKEVTRSFAWMAPNVALGEVDTMAIYLGEMADGKYDGAAFTSDEFVAEVFSEKLGLEIDHEIVQGFALQTRPASNKTNAQVVRSDFHELITEGKELIVLDRNNMNMEDMEAVNATIQKISKENKGKVVIVTSKKDFDINKDRIDFISDLNGLKTAFDWSRNIEFNVLDMSIAKSYIGGANTSIQMLQGLLNADPAEGINFVAQLREKALYAAFEENFKITKEELVATNKRANVAKAVKIILELETKREAGEDIAINELVNYVGAEDKDRLTAIITSGKTEEEINVDLATEFLAILEKFDAEVDELTEVIDGLQQVRETAGKVPTIKAISATSVFARNILFDITEGRCISEDVSVFRHKIKTFVDKMKSIDNKFHYAIDGCFARIMSDISALAMKSGILNGYEMYVPGTEEYFRGIEATDEFDALDSEDKETIRRKLVTLFKYPKIGLNEHFQVECITLDVITSRIKRALKGRLISKKQAKIIEAYFRNLKKGNVVVPAEKWVMELLAGLDFDWDGGTLVLDPKFNTILRKAERIVVKIDHKDTESTQSAVAKKAAAMAAKFAAKGFDKVQALNVQDNSAAGFAAQATDLTLDNYYKAFELYVRTNKDSLSIGGLTNLSATHDAAYLNLKAAVQNKDKEAILKAATVMLNMLRSDIYLNGQGGKGDYQELERTTKTIEATCLFDFGATTEENFDDSADVTYTQVRVSPSTINNMIASVKNCSWNNIKNLTKIFFDLNCLYRYYQEMTIDSAKTGISVQIQIAPGLLFHALMLNKNDYNLDFSNAVEGVKEDVFSYRINEDCPSTVVNGSLVEKQPVIDLLYTLRVSFVAPLADIVNDIATQNTLYVPEGGVDRHVNQMNVRMVNNAQFREQVLATYTMKNIYSDAASNYMEESHKINERFSKISAPSEMEIESFEREKEDANERFSAYTAAIRNMVMSYTDHLTLEQRGMFIKAICIMALQQDKSGNTYELYAKKHQSFSFLSSCFAPEQISAAAKQEGNIDFCGSPIILNAFNGTFFAEGDTIELEKGVNEYARTADPITGTFEVREYNGVLFAAQPIQDVLRTEATDTLAIRLAAKAGEEDKAAYFEKAAAEIAEATDLNLRARREVINNKSVFQYGVFSGDTEICGIETTHAISNFIDGQKVEFSHSILRNEEPTFTEENGQQVAKYTKDAYAIILFNTVK